MSWTYACSTCCHLSLGRITCSATRARRPWLAAKAPFSSFPLSQTRSLDSPDLSHVFFMEVPEGRVDPYTHIAGRTGLFGMAGRTFLDLLMQDSYFTPPYLLLCASYLPTALYTRFIDLTSFVRCSLGARQDETIGLKMSPLCCA